MAVGLHSNFVIYHEQLQTGFNETLQQETEAFNAASLGAITMRQNLTDGYYLQEAFFSAVSGLASRRDLTADPATPVTDLALSEEEGVLVKLFRKIGPIAMSRGAFRTIGRDPGEFSVLIGQQAAKAAMIDQLNSGLRAAVAALANTATLAHNVTAASPVDIISTDNLIQALAKAGDSQGGVIL